VFRPVGTSTGPIFAGYPPNAFGILAAPMANGSAMSVARSWHPSRGWLLVAGVPAAWMYAWAAAGEDRPERGANARAGR
jgi:hypothetical protein